MRTICHGNSAEGIQAWLVAAAVAATAVLIVAPPHAVPQASHSGSGFVAGDAKAGMQIFIQKRCAHCHILFGDGRRGAPNLARASSSRADGWDLVAGMWNHAPAMWKEMKVRQVPLPTFTEGEMISLFAFLYSIRSVDEPGVPERGRHLFAEKGCIACHRIGRKGGRVGPDLKTLRDRLNLVIWIRAMWNHAPVMAAQMEARGFRWPELQANDVADIISYLQGSDHRALPRLLRILPLRPADSEAGQVLFEKKGCASCHSVHGVGPSDAAELVSTPLPRTLPQFVARMWNHIPAMRARMQARSVRHAEFSDQEMADLIAYLFVEQFFETKGDHTIGRQLFKKKGCGSCHNSEDESTRPRLSLRKAPSTPARFATVLWNHGPAMFNMLGDRVDFWPQFWPGEMTDLIAYLDSISSPKRLADSHR